MSSAGLTPAVKDFIREHIQSVAQIEALDLVQSAPERDWTLRSVDEILRSNEDSIGRNSQASRALACLHPRAATPAAYRYQPQPVALADAAAETVRAYRARPVLVIETIFKPDDSAQSSADAFRIRPR